MKFIKKPVVIEAYPVTESFMEDEANWPAWLKDAHKRDAAEVGSIIFVAEPLPKVLISTLEGVMTCSIGDWIIQGVQGELYPCKPDIFEQTYEAFIG